MARNGQIGTREIRAVQTLLTGRSWPARIGAIVVLVVFAWGWWNHGSGSATSGAMAAGQVLSGEVVSVTDGDTVTLLDGEQRQYKLRLAFIDAPEKSQPFGQAAKQHLSDLVYRKRVSATVIDVDRYQRGVAVIDVAGASANYAQVAAGLAWHYQRYARGKQSSGEFDRFEVAESTARQQQSGLWQDANPTPPWDYRRAQRSAD
ncbi:thermonuclease family protein [Andreprevotia chitinilytica]|uniref:thermonuclease family protein n=1 Tax=Andreprevotia chitinilytica TaxID=396808 RepID=UPI00055473CB|nr:thermonuclease family protein [Andreprevotia chitinilytica]